MSSLNKACLIGLVGKDPEIRTTQGGSRVASFGLATSEKWKSKSGEKQEETTWHNIVIWNEGIVKLVENYVNKGDKLYIEGQIKNRKWQDKDGVDRYTTEIVLKPYSGTITLLGGGKEKPEKQENSQNSSHDDFEDEIPF